MARGPKKISDFDVALGGVVRSKRVKKKLSQTAVAEAVGIPLSNYQRREDGSVEITTSELYRIATIVDVPAVKLVEEALHDYGGIDKLILEFVSTSAVDATVTAEDKVDFLGDVKARYDIAADENPSK